MSQSSLWANASALALSRGSGSKHEHDILRTLCSPSLSLLSLLPAPDLTNSIPEQKLRYFDFALRQQRPFYPYKLVRSYPKKSFCPYTEKRDCHTKACLSA